MWVKKSPAKSVLPGADGQPEGALSVAAVLSTTDSFADANEKISQILLSCEGMLDNASRYPRNEANEDLQRSEVNVSRVTERMEYTTKKSRPRKYPAEKTRSNANSADQPIRTLSQRSLRMVKKSAMKIWELKKDNDASSLKESKWKQQKNLCESVRDVFPKNEMKTSTVGKYPPVLIRSRIVKPLERRKIAFELRRPRERKKVNDVANKERKSKEQKKKLCWDLRTVTAKPRSITSVKHASFRILTRFGRPVKPVERYGVIVEYHKRWERKGVVCVDKVKRQNWKQKKELSNKVRGARSEAAALKMPVAETGVNAEFRGNTVKRQNITRKEVVNRKTQSDSFQQGLLNYGLDKEQVFTLKRRSPRRKSSIAEVCAGKVIATTPQKRGTNDIWVAASQRQLQNKAKEREREVKRTTSETKNKIKFEEMRRKRDARKLKKEMKEKLLKEKRERRETERKKQEEEQLARKKRKTPITMLRTANEEQKYFVSSSCDGVVPVTDMSFCWQIFVSGQVFLNRWLILDEISPHRSGVVSYYVMENSSVDKTQGILLAQNINNQFAGLPEEAYFLQMQSERNRSYMFHTVVDAHFVSATAQSPTLFYYVVMLRESASLKDIWTNYPGFLGENGRRKAWSLGTVGRLAADILSIIEVTYEAGYTFRSIDMSHFHLDLRTRRLYLDNTAELVVSTELKDLRLASGEYVYHNYWRGCVEYAPLSWHHKGRESIMRVADCAEVLFYIMLDMLGLLTWRGMSSRQTAIYKEEFVELNRKQLPVPLIDYWEVVRRAQEIDARKLLRQDDYLLLDGVRGGATVSVLNFRTLFARLLTMYKIFGEVADEDTPYDFEVLDDPRKRSFEQQSLVRLFQEAEMLRYKLEVLRADFDALVTRDEFVNRNAAQANRERAFSTRRCENRHRARYHASSFDDCEDD